VGALKIAVRGAAITTAAVSLAVPALSAETVTYSYDAKGRLVKVVRTGTVNNNVTVEYTHDKADNRTRVKTTNSPNPPP
jgi:hypothetical protein